MTLAMSASAIYAREADTPAEMLRKLDDALSDELSTTEMYLTAFYGVIDPAAGSLTYANAGHAHAFVVRADGRADRLLATDPPVGFAGPDSYRQETVPWTGPDDLLLLFTDGLPDAISARNVELFCICMREYAAYRPRRFAGRIAIFRTAHPRFDLCDPLPLWKRLTDGVDVFTIAGTHGTIMEKHHVSSVARQLSRYLAGAGGGRVNGWQEQTEAPYAGAVVASEERHRRVTT
jgi:hypothetical protein